MSIDFDTPLARVLTIGYAGATIPDLVSVAISSDADSVLDAEVRAKHLLNERGSILAMADLSREQLVRLSGFDEFRACQALAWLEIGRRTIQAGRGEPVTMLNPISVKRLLSGLTQEKREHFIVILLDAKNNLIRYSTVHIGTLTMSVVGPREVFREAIREGASSIIVAHNHPSGDPEPSPEDIKITHKLEELGDMLDIKVWDHIVLGHGDRFVSLRDRGLMRR